MEIMILNTPHDWNFNGESTIISQADAHRLLIKEIWFGRGKCMPNLSFYLNLVFSWCYVDIILHITTTRLAYTWFSPAATR